MSLRSSKILVRLQGLDIYFYSSQNKPKSGDNKAKTRHSYRFRNRMRGLLRLPGFEYEPVPLERRRHCAVWKNPAGKCTRRFQE